MRTVTPRLQTDPRTGYVPLDEWSDRPRVRILRKLRWFPDGVTASDLFDALEAWETADRNNYAHLLLRMVRSGDVERVNGLYRSVVRVVAPSVEPYCEADE